MKNVLVMIGLAISLVSPSWAGITVDITDYPTTVLQYEPIVITARVENHGKDSVLIPASGFTENRYVIRTGSTAGDLADFQPLDSSGGGSLIWLKPGASWFFQYDLGPWYHDVGRLFVATGIRSNGRCQYRATGAEQFPLELVHDVPGNKKYKCWSGEVASHVVSIEITEPRASIDREALEYLSSTEFPYSGMLETVGLRYGFSELTDRFPSSKYTYAAGYYGCRKSPSCLQQLLKDQPSQPLSPYMRLQLARALLESERRAEVTASFIKGLDLPDGLEPYLVQLVRVNTTSGTEQRKKGDCGP